MQRPSASAPSNCSQPRRRPVRTDSAESPWLEAFRNHRQSAGISPYTIRGDAGSVAYFARWLGSDPATASREDVLRFVHEYRAHCAPSSTLNRLTSLRAFYRWCRPHNDPTEGIRIAQPRHEPKRPYTRDELRRILAVCETPRDRALILMLVSTGLRRGELAGMRGDDIDWERGLVRVEGKGMRRRWLAPGPTAMAALGPMRNGPGPVWYGRRGNPLTVDGLYQVVKRLAMRASVGDGYVHRFRTTWANEFLRETRGDIQSAQVLMGHAKISQTAQYAAWSRAERALEQARRVGLAERIA